MTMITKEQEIIIETAKKLGADETQIVGGSLFCKVSTSSTATKIKNFLEMVLDNTKVDLFHLTGIEYAYDFIPKK